MRHCSGNRYEHEKYENTRIIWPPTTIALDIPIVAHSVAIPIRTTPALPLCYRVDPPARGRWYLVVVER